MMIRRKVTGIRLGIGAAILLLALAIAWAQSGGGFSLSWWKAGGGGAVATGGPYALAATVMGQHDAGMLRGGPYIILGGVLSDAPVGPAAVRSWRLYE